jgi:hypothetical protein
MRSIGTGAGERFFAPVLKSFHHFFNAGVGAKHSGDRMICQSALHPNASPWKVNEFRSGEIP